MAWTIKINRPHARLWRRYLMAWLAFVAFGLVIGAYLKPRADEIIFMVTLPLAIVVPYALLCLGVAAVRSLLPPGGVVAWRQRRIGRQRTGRWPERS